MSSTTEAAGLPEPINQLLQNLVEAARAAFRDDLKSVVLFGSGAEGRLRPTSDLNLLLVLKQFDQGRVDVFREPLRVAQVAARASVMFLMEAELSDAAEAFAVKFDDIARRRRVLYGEDVFAHLQVSRGALKQRLRQVLLNLTLRLRERYAADSLREEQLALVIAEAGGPLRAAASTLCDLEGRPAASPRESLERVVAALGGAEGANLPAAISQARQSRSLPAGAAARLMFQLIKLCEAMRLRTERLD